MFACLLVLSVLVPPLLAACSKADLQQDPRQSKYAKLLQESYEVSSKQLDEELAKDPLSLQARFARATVEVEYGNLNKGLEMFDKLLTDYPSYAFGYSQRAQALYAAGKFDQALLDINLAIRYRPDVPRNYARRAMILLAMHQPEKALEDLKTATSLDPSQDSVFVKVLTGKAYMELGQYHEALPILTESVQRGKNDVRPYLERALCYARLKNWQAAIADSNKAFTINPKDLHTRFLHAALLSATDERAKARRELTEIMKSDPPAKVVADAADIGSGSPAFADVALACLDLHKPQLAKSILVYVEGRRPLEAEELFALGKVELALGDLFRAAKLFNECLAIQPTWAEPRVELIKLYVRDRLPQKAKEVQKEGLDLPLSAEDRKKISSAI